MEVGHAVLLSVNIFYPKLHRDKLGNLLRETVTGSCIKFELSYMGDMLMLLHNYVVQLVH